ncbi:glycosyltransferase [Bacillus sp. JJ1566]|uniref:glycosyltransferase n=1 Tax=Bacillus sp. JJ1566 TaxID=3122961 RepID=UPI002FFD6D28
MKTRLLFAIDSLVGAGAEKSLITLLSLLDYRKYSVDLVLFAHGEILEELVPKEVNILRPFKYTEFANLNLLRAFYYSIKEKNFKMLYSRIMYSLKIRLKKYNNPEKARVYWENVSNVIEENNKKYDIAISYAQGVPTFFVAEKTKAEKKFAWINVSYRLDKKNADFQQKYYDIYNKIVAVSNSAKEIFLETFPNYDNKMEVIYDINNPDFIVNMAKLNEGYSDNFGGYRILTIGRLAYQKGYDIALEACRLLKKQGVNFRWYVLGKGPLESEILEYIKINNLEENFILLGVTSNPYPYVKNCDFYVQTSRFEGFGLAIAEARMLNIPVVTTRFDAVYSQMIDGENGLVVDMNADAVSKGILKLMKNHQLREEIKKNLKKEKKGNIEELDKFYALIG